MLPTPSTSVNEDRNASLRTRNGSLIYDWKRQSELKYHKTFTVEALVSGNPTEVKKVSVTGAGRLPKFKNTDLWRRLLKKKVGCPLSRVSIRRASTVFEYKLSFSVHSTARWSVTSLRGPGDRHFNAVSHQPMRAPIQFNLFPSALVYGIRH